MRPTGLLSVTFRNLPFERIIEMTAQAGLDGIEWGGDVHVPPGELKLAERIGQAAREAGLINFLQTHDDPEKFLRFREPALRKDEIKKALKDGFVIPGAVLEETESVVIK